MFKLEGEDSFFRKSGDFVGDVYTQESHMIFFAVRAPHLDLMRPAISRQLDYLPEILPEPTSPK